MYTIYVPVHRDVYGVHIILHQKMKIILSWALTFLYTLCIISNVRRGLGGNPVKIQITLEIKRSTQSKKKSSTPKKPQVQSNSQKTNIIISQK